MIDPNDPPALFLWDIDGTLLRGPNTVHHDAFAHAFRTVYGLPLSLEGVNAAGRTDTWLLHEPLRRQGLSDEEIRARLPQAYAAMNDYVDRHLGDVRDRVLPGVPEVLSLLDRPGIYLGLLTGNLAPIAWRKMERAGLAGHFDGGGFGEESTARPDLVPAAVRHFVARIGRPLDLARVVLIGDTALDIEAAHAHGAKVCAVATGRVSVEELGRHHPDLLRADLTPPAEAAAALLAMVGA